MPANNFEEKPYSEKELFLQAQELMDIKPLQLHFLKDDYQLSHNTRSMIQKWAKRIRRYNVPIYIHSLSSIPNGIRNLTDDTANHEAIRTALNRGLIIKSLLERHGIAKNQLIIKTVPPKNMQPGNKLKDMIIITTHRD